MAQASSHLYGVEKEEVLKSVETIISSSDTEANNFIDSMNPEGAKRYYSATVNNSAIFYTNSTSAATHFSYK